MPSTYPVPSVDEIREVIADLVGRAVDVEMSAGAVGADAPGVLGEYGDDDGPLGAVCLADLALAQVLGHALNMEPPEAVEEAIQQGAIADTTVENLHEVLNTLARLLNTDCTPALRLRGVHRLPDDAPAAATELLDNARGRRTYGITVTDYGSGVLALAVG
jgi:hypothetical protein